MVVVFKNLTENLIGGIIKRRNFGVTEDPLRWWRSRGAAATTAVATPVERGQPVGWSS